MAIPEVDFTVQCSKGFYVRSYAYDIGKALGCGAHLSALRRTQSGRFTLDRAITVETPENRAQGGVVPGNAFPGGTGGHPDCQVKACLFTRSSSN